MTRARIGWISSGLSAFQSTASSSTPSDDGRQGDGRQVDHAAEHQGGEGGEQHVEGAGEAEGQAQDPGPQEEGQERQHAWRWSTPGSAAAAPGCRAARPGPALGRGPHRDAHVGALQEEGDGDHGQRRHDQGEQVVGVEDERRDLEA